jgi:major vault protein
MANERDMVLAPNEYMYVSDETKGNVDIFVGPAKSSLSGTDQPVIFDEKTKRFKKVEFKDAIQTDKTAPEGWYVVLKNPAEGDKFPVTQGKATAPELTVGRKVNIPGPVSFALWPGQMAKVLKGHHLRSNQYLLVRVYDEEAARANWGKAVIKTTEDTKTDLIKATELSMGQLLVIKGTQVSFYIPPTGVEVVQDEKGNLVRDAVTLERLEYCLLMDENGNKRYEKGPAVVFPEPTEVFIERESNGSKTRKFRAIELNENSGLYVKVIADYKEGDRDFKVGDELFITGKEQMIYFPREEHAIVKYDKNEIHFGIAIPSGEARYVLDRNNGSIELVRGPKVFLPDPRSQVIVRRILDYRTCSLLYPNNQAAFQYNARLAGVDLNTYLSDSNIAAVAGAAALVAAAAPAGIRGFSGGPSLFGSPGAYSSVNYLAASVDDSLEGHGLGGASAEGFSGDAFDRKTSYTEPRTITLPTKFDGAVSIEVWTGYAITLVKKDGERRVVKGPQTVMLDYDESPQIMELSRGKPKTTDQLLKTVFLRITANKVSDIIEVETRDFCKLNVKVSYRLHFEGDPEKWFDVENYVKFLCDNMRSRLRNAVLKFGIEEFYGHHTDILRDIILGTTTEDEPRPGTAFEENGMRIYDVEILNVSIQHPEVEKMIVSAQREVIQNTLAIQAQRRKLLFTQESETIKQSEAEALAETKKKQFTLQATEATNKLALDIIIIESNATAEAKRLTKSLEAENATTEVEKVKLNRRVETRQTEIDLDDKILQVRIKEIQAEVQAVVEKAAAVSPDLIAALSTFGDRAMVEKVATAMAPLSILGGGSVVEILSKILKDTYLGKQLEAANGSSGSKPSSATARP